MSFRVVRQSKFRHVFGNPHKQGFDGLRVTRNAWDSNFCSVNPKFLAVALEAQGGGQFAVLNLDGPSRVELNTPKVVGHTAPVLDIQFCPYNDHLIASAAEDCTVKVWQIPEGGIEKNLAEPVCSLVGHQRRVGIVEWHPTAEHVLLSAGFDYLIIAWDVSTASILKQVECHTDTIYSVAFNWSGSLLATTSKDKIIRVIDVAGGKVVSQGPGHEGTKASRITWTGETNMLFTTGFSKQSERQVAIWNPNDLAKPLKLEMVDTSSGVLFCAYDNDTQVMYVNGKGDGNIRYYEIDTEAPYIHFLSEYKTQNPQRGIAFMPKRGLNVAECEIMRAYKLTPKGSVDIISFIVPRKSTMFQEDIFPPTKKDEPVVTAAEWLAGADGTPKKVSMKEGYVPPTREEIPVTASAVAKEDQPPEGEKALLKAWHAHKDEIKQLKAQINTLEIKLRGLQA